MTYVPSPAVAALIGAYRACRADGRTVANLGQLEALIFRLVSDESEMPLVEAMAWLEEALAGAPAPRQIEILNSGGEVRAIADGRIVGTVCRRGAPAGSGRTWVWVAEVLGETTGHATKAEARTELERRANAI